MPTWSRCATRGIIASTKFLAGAWIVVVLIPLLVVMFLGIRYHYQRVERELTTSLPFHQKDIQHRLIVPVVSLNLAAKYSLVYARSISPHVGAIHIATKNGTGALRTVLFVGISGKNERNML